MRPDLVIWIGFGGIWVVHDALVKRVIAHHMHDVAKNNDGHRVDWLHVEAQFGISALLRLFRRQPHIWRLPGRRQPNARAGDSSSPVRARIIKYRKLSDPKNDQPVVHRRHLELRRHTVVSVQWVSRLCSLEYRNTCFRGEKLQRQRACERVAM